MPNKMLIDASHPEETRVVVTRGNRIEEFDFESRDKKQLRGNIYLARVTRVEPSLQAAFVEYGGNRHGFLAFSEIHPDYYQIPVADRQALLKAEAEAADLEDEEEEEERGRGRRRRRGKGPQRNSRKRDGATAEASASEDGESDSVAEAESVETGETGVEQVSGDEAAASEPVSGHDAEPAEGPEAPDGVADTGDADDKDEGDDTPRSMAAAIEADTVSEPAPEPGEGDEGGHGEVEEAPQPSAGEDEVESVGAEDALEELPNRRRQMRRQYKIQEVIKRRQILLVQVVKEERGNKGAALTTYLSLAGRYSVLMPNTARGGGISRKITSAEDRKRLKDVVEDLDVPEGMGVILRTAGANRTKPEIKRDYEYLMRMWETVRTTTLQSTAPALVYEEGSLIKRSVRDLYNKDIEEIVVAGEEGYREAKDFMRMLMPSHAKVVQPYRDIVPIFARNGIEAQLDRMLQPQVTLKSGGYIIINQTEALVSIDVNSGRSTREHSIEDTALQTNLEAAEEVARQLRLRDLAGLIVIDFIDMEENRNNRAVEKRLKDHLKNDRARIQVGRISHFGLLEMSRQRIRASVLDSTMKPCPHCGGTGHIRSDSSVALHVIRAVEEFLLKDNRSHITVRTPAATALYVLNQKRRNLSDLEARFGLTITIEADETLGTQHYAITRGAPVERPVTPVLPTMPEPTPEDLRDEEVEPDTVEDEAETEETAAASPYRRDEAEEGEDGGRRKKRRRRRRRGGRDREDGETNGVHADGSAQDGSAEDEDGESDADADAEKPATVEAEDGADRKKRRRGKRGGRRNRDDRPEGEAQAADDGAEGEVQSSDGQGSEGPTHVVAQTAPDEVVTEEAPLAANADVAAEPVESPAEPEPAEPVEAPAEPAPRPRRRAFASDATSEPVAETPAEPAEDKPKKAGWWQRKGFF